MIKKFAFYTLGCRLNQAEEEKLKREVTSLGFTVTAPVNADVIIINTCSVTALADKKSRQAISSLIKNNRKAKIVVIGCGANGAMLLPGVALIIGNKGKEDAVRIILKTLGITIPYKAVKGIKTEQSRRTRALLKVQDGCNNFCAYCIVPFLRGREVSIPSKLVTREAKELERLGYKELVISGVNVGKYRDEGLDLEGLLKELLAETSFARIRLSSVNPQDVTNSLIALWAKEPRLCRHFHLSLQSGSSSVLSRMKRPYNVQQYYSLTKKIVQKLPDVAITTDVIVGFPGETDKEFEETLSFVKKIGFAKLHVFRYSKRTGTAAAEMPDQVSAEVKEKRSKKLRDLGDKLRMDYRERYIGKAMEVLFEEKKGDYWYGLTSNYIRVKHKSAENLENELKTIEIKRENIA